MSQVEQEPNYQVLRYGALGLPVVMVLAALLLGQLTNSLIAFLSVCCIYWIACWTIFFCSDEPTSLVSMYRSPLNRKLVEFVMTWLPLLAVFLVTITSPWPSLPLWVSLVILGIACINGVTEEAFWRGKFVATFPTQISWALIFPTIVFTLWHIALLCIPNIEYEAGALGMLGGAAIMGSLWGYAHWRTHDLRSVTVSHVLTNFCAFSILTQANWYHG